MMNIMKRVEAIQFTMTHDDGKNLKDIENSDIIILGVSRTSKTPTSIYLANRGFKTSNIPLIDKNSIPENIKKNERNICIVGLTTDPERLIDLRKNRLRTLRENEKSSYTNLKKISEEVQEARKTFKKYKWPVIDVTRKSVEETAASIIKIYEISKKMFNLILASKSKVRLEILEKNGLNCEVVPSNIDEEPVKESLVNEGATPEIVSKNLAELKANKVSQQNEGRIVIGADSIIDLENEVISKPTDRNEAMKILEKLNGKEHYLISSVCVSKNGSMIWNYTDKARLKMKNFKKSELEIYLSKISDEKLYSYNVYQIEDEGKNLFDEINGDKNTIMGLPIKKIKEYLKNL